MFFFEIINLFLAILLGVICTISDARKGVVYNKILVFFSIAAVLTDSIYYGIFARDLFFDFLPNLFVMCIICLYLFYSHTFAGGDCKFAIVLAMLYPARYYVVYADRILTLYFSLGFAIIAGYIYLLMNALKALTTRKVAISFEYIKEYISSFLGSYLPAMLYVILLNSLIILLQKFGLNLNMWIVRLGCFAIVWCVGRYSILKKYYVILPSFIITIVLGIITRVIPISLNPENYVLLLILLLCQMVIKTTIYERIEVSMLQKGMILTTFSSVLMQSSITKGLPSVSSEDLRSRLTEDEVKSVKIWAKATHTTELSVVKKIPFAIFIAIGFASYFILWSFGI